MIGITISKSPPLIFCDMTSPFTINERSHKVAYSPLYLFLIVREILNIMIKQVDVDKVIKGITMTQR
jgi:hypothetical protein